MEFVNPAFLYGLFALAVPVVIHLFNFRRFRKVYFTNVRYIEELRQETQKQSRLKHLIILLLRMLAVAAIVLAFARPFIPMADRAVQIQQQSHVSVYLDNSFSMQSGSEEGSLLQRAQARAREIAGVYKSTDRFQLLTNDFEGRHQRFVSREEFLEMVDEVEFTGVVRSLKEVVSRQSDLHNFDNAKNRTSYILSDFQTHFLANEFSATDTTVEVFFVPVQAEVIENLYIDSCWFDAPVQQVNQVVSLFLRIRNASGQLFEDLPVKLSINGSQKALSSFEIGPYSEKTIAMTFTNTQTGIQSGVLEINDYPVNFDDKLYFSYYVSPKIRVLSINQDGPSFFLQSLFSGDSLVFFENIDVDRLDFSKVDDFDFVILNGVEVLSSGLIQEAMRFFSAGGTLLLFPPAELDLNAYNGFLVSAGVGKISGLDSTGQRVGEINLQHPLYSGVFDEVPENMDLPAVNKHYIIQDNTQTRVVRLLQMQNGNPFLSRYEVEQGTLYLSAVPLDPVFSNLPRHPLFVPSVYKMAVLSLRTDVLYYILGKSEVVRIESLRNSPEDVMKITDGKGTFEVIPEHRRAGHQEDLNVHGQIVAAGNYFLEHSNEQIRGLSFNYDRDESDLEIVSQEELVQYIERKRWKGAQVLKSSGQTLATTLEEMSRGIQLWKYFVLAALGLLLLEVLLLRFWRTN